MRLFVAIPLPADVAERAARSLPEDLPALRRVRPELLHVTLAFLGETPEARRPTVRRAVADAARGSRPFEVGLGALGRFPPKGDPTTVWLTIDEGAPALVRLGEAVRGALRRLHVTFDDKPFRPHITLARVRPEASPDDSRRIAAAVAASAPVALRFRADAVDVIQSVLSPRGSRYSSLDRVALGARGPASERVARASGDEEGGT